MQAAKHEAPMGMNEQCDWLDLWLVSERMGTQTQTVRHRWKVCIGATYACKAMCSPCTAARAATCTSIQSSHTARTLNAVPRARTTGLCCWQRPDSSHRRHTAQLCRSSDRDAGRVASLQKILIKLQCLNAVNCSVDLVESMKNDMERLQRKQTADSSFTGQSELRQVPSAVV